MKVFLKYDIPETGNELAGLAKFAMEKHMEREKYRVMWQLRSLEQEINESEGMIIITQGGRIHTKNFTRELTDKILLLLSRDED